MRNKEIERRFWVDIDKIPNLSKHDYLDISQGYANGLGDYQFRLRQIINMTPIGPPIGEQYTQTIKSYGNLVRDEFEISLLKPQFSELWPLCSENILHKCRYTLKMNDSYKIELDIFKNNLSGLVLAEVEFSTIEEAEKYIPEEWFGYEVTNDSFFKNYNLAKFGLSKIISKTGLKLKCVDCGGYFTEQITHKCVDGIKNKQPKFKIVNYGD